MCLTEGGSGTGPRGPLSVWCRYGLPGPGRAQTPREARADGRAGASRKDACKGPPASTNRRFRAGSRRGRASFGRTPRARHTHTSQQGRTYGASLTHQERTAVRVETSGPLHASSGQTVTREARAREVARAFRRERHAPAIDVAQPRARVDETRARRARWSRERVANAVSVGHRSIGDSSRDARSVDRRLRCLVG